MMLTFTILIIPYQLLNLLAKITVDVQIKYHFSGLRMVRFLGQDARPDRVLLMTPSQDVPGPGQGEDGWLHVGEYIIEHRDSAAMIEKSKTLAMFSDFAKRWVV